MIPQDAEYVSVQRADLLALLQLEERPRAVPTESELWAIRRLREALGFRLDDEAGWVHSVRDGAE